MPANAPSPAQVILDELVLSRRRMLAREVQDAHLLEANRRAIAYWAKRIRNTSGDSPSAGARSDTAA